jgi:uncharacterized protein
MTALPESLLEQVAQRLVAELEPEAIYLFGSHAWGQPTEDSDLDLLVVLPDSAPPTHEDFVRAHRSLAELSVSTDVLLETRAQFDRFRPVRASLAHKVARKGKLLYERTRRPERVGASLAGEG